MKSKKQMKAEALSAAQDQLKTRSQVADIIRDELMAQLEGGSFWSELKELIHHNKPTPAASKHEPAGKAETKSKSKRRLNPAMKTRGELVKRIMAEKNMNLAQASKYIKDNALM